MERVLTTVVLFVLALLPRDMCLCHYLAVESHSIVIHSGDTSPDEPADEGEHECSCRLCEPLAEGPTPLQLERADPNSMHSLLIPSLAPEPADTGVDFDRLFALRPFNESSPLFMRALRI